MLYGPQHDLPTELVRRLQLRYSDILRRRLAVLRPDVDADRMVFVVTCVQGMAHALTLQSMWLGHGEVPADGARAIAARGALMLDDDLPVPALASPRR